MPCCIGWVINRSPQYSATSALFGQIVLIVAQQIPLLMHTACYTRGTGGRQPVLRLACSPAISAVQAR